MSVPLKDLALFSTLYLGGTVEYGYSYFQNYQKFALSGGVSFEILTHSNLRHAVIVFISV